MCNKYIHTTAYQFLSILQQTWGKNMGEEKDVNEGSEVDKKKGRCKNKRKNIETFITLYFKNGDALFNTLSSRKLDTTLLR